jgi:hypothetical protein
MTLRGWQATCVECEWSVHAVHREQAEAGKRVHEQTTGHKNVTVYSVTESDASRRWSSSEEPAT